MKDKMSNKVIETSDYGKFKVTVENRGVDSPHVRKLAISMKRHGWWDGFPMVVCSAPGGKFIIRDGQNRFRAAQSLNIPVKYIVDEASASIPLSELNGEHRNWKMLDYITSHAHSGDKDYTIALNFIRAHKAPVSVACSLLNKSGVNCKSIINGTFVVLDVDWAEARLRELNEMKPFLEFGAMAVNFVRSYIKASQVQNFNHSAFLDRVKKYSHMLPTQPNEESYVEAIERVYNYRNQTPLPIKFEAMEITRARRGVSPARAKAIAKKKAA